MTSDDFGWLPIPESVPEGDRHPADEQAEEDVETFTFTNTYLFY